MNDSGARFDYVIVGGGSAGSLLAARLAEAGGVTICLLEAGPPDKSAFIKIPAGFIKVIFDPKLTWSFQTEPGPAINDRQLPAIQGKVVGGSGSINGMVYTRGQAEDYDTWAQRGNTGWSYSEVLPYFRKSERRIGNGDPQIRGRDGALPVVDLLWKNTLTDAFIASTESLGIPFNADYNGRTQEGVGRYQYTIDRGQRYSAARAFLHKARRRDTIDLRTECAVTSVLFDGKTATGVRYIRAGDSTPHEVFAQREVILCAGAINTPRLLQISGVGPSDLLQDLGVPVVHELPGVGAHLRDHYTPRTVLKAKDTVTINDMAHGARLAGQTIRWLLRRPSILGIGVVLGAAFCKSHPDLDRPDIVVTFTPGSFKAGFLGVLDDIPGMTCGTWQLRPESEGHVKARSRDIFVPPAVQPNYLTAEKDRQVLLAGMKLVRRVLAVDGMARYCDTEILPGPAVQTDDELLDYARKQGLGGYHYCGTCRMGPATDATAVVDNSLKVHGLDRLRVVDASIMPTITSGNTNAPTMMIAEKAAAMMLSAQR